jgi:hypothetical protein
VTIAARLRAIVDSLPPGASVLLPADTLREWLADDELPAADARRGEVTVPDQLIGADDVALRLDISRRAVYRRAGSWPFTRRVGRTVKFSAAGLERWLARQR